MRTYNLPPATYPAALTKKAGASTHLAASVALRRGEALGDIDDKSAKDFQKQIDDLERKVKGKQATRSAFDKLRDGVASLLKKQARADNPGSAPKP